jgi:Domain of unknown function (DUF4919)
MGFRNWVLAALLLLGLAGLPAAAKDAAKVDPAAIAAMIEKAKANDPATDMTWLRRENARGLGYMPPDWAEAGKAFDALEKDPAKAIELANKQIKLNPLDIDANLLIEIASEKLGRKDEQARQHNLLMALLKSVMAGMDGKTTGTAWNAVSVDEEYQVLRLIGLKPKSQALLNDKGSNFDAMTVTNPDDGKELTIHFNIDFFFGKQFEGLGT